jgi:hypothetical protein
MGRGSHVMVVVFLAETCNPDFGWGVFRLTGGKWRYVWKYPNGQLSIVAVGSNLKETVGILRPGDPRCKSTGGTRTRTWHWNGHRFVASAWATHLPLSSNATEFRARPPGGLIQCAFATEARLVCTAALLATGSSAQWAMLHPDGRLEPCSETSPRDYHCFSGNFGERPPELSPGQKTTISSYVCTALATGVECVVAATGKGFLITTERVSRIGP